MIRTALYSVFALLIVSGFAGAADKAAKAAKKNGTAVSGTFESFSDGKLTVTVKGKKGEPGTKKEFKIADDTKVVVLNGEEKKELVGKDGFKDAKTGSLVTVKVGEGDKVEGVQISAGKKKKTDK